MKDKKWVNCPVCGSKQTMKFKRNVTLNMKDITLKKLAGYFCTNCSDGFYNIASEKKIEMEIAKQRAIQDSKKVTASELTTVEEVARKFKKSKQRIHQMLDEGKLRYVFIGKYRFPLVNQELLGKKAAHTSSLKAN